MTRFPTDEHDIIYRHACLTAGFTDTDLARARSHGEITQLVRGAYIPAQHRERAEIHRLAVIATSRLGRFDESVPSHQSAAALHRLPMLLVRSRCPPDPGRFNLFDLLILAEVVSAMNRGCKVTGYASLVRNSHINCYSGPLNTADPRGVIFDDRARRTRSHTAVSVGREPMPLRHRG